MTDQNYDAFEFDAPDEIGDAGNYLREPGTYHCLVKAVHPNHTAGGKKLLKAPGGFSVDLKVLAGTTDANGAETSLTFFNGKTSDKDGGKFARVKQAAFFVAANLLEPSQLGKPGLKINLAASRGAQIVVRLEKDEHNSTSDRTYLQLGGAGVHHVDDPKVADIPKDAEVLKMIPPDFRRKSEYFDALQKKSQGGGGGAAAASGSGGSPPPAGLSQSQLDSL